MTRGWLIAAAAGVVTVALVATLVVVVVRRDEGAAPPPQASATPSPTPSVTKSPKPKRRPVLGVKIDNAAAARPQTGLSRADIVYVEPVEAGLSRFLAVYSRGVPKTVGPVRSARGTDLQLLRQFKKPALAFSGAHGGLIPSIRRAPLRDRSPSRAGGAYFRGGSNPAPHNLYANPRKFFKRPSNAGHAGSGVGFRFGKAPAGGKKTSARKVSYRAASFAFRWSAKQDRWLVTMDGSPGRAAGGGRLGAPTVVVQYVTVRPSRLKDVLGNPSPYAKTVGRGKAMVLRDGKAYRARWSRPKAGKGTMFTTRNGDPMTFARGPVWIVFASRSG